MCWAAIPAWVGMAASIGSGAMAAASSIQQGNQAKASAEFNAKVAQQNAQRAENDMATVQEQAAMERRRLGAEHRGAVGELQAGYAAMGVDPGFGTPADLVGDLGQAYSIDRSIIDRNMTSSLQRLDQERADLLNGAKLGLAEGAAAKRAGYYNAAGSLLSTASSVSGKWSTPKKPAVVKTGPNYWG